MDKARYLAMCEQLGDEPDPEKMPPGIEDMPEIVHIAITIFNRLGDKVYPEIGYTGKDYTNLNHYIKIYKVDNVDLLLEILNWIDQRAIKKSSDEIKREMEKLKREAKRGKK